MGILKSNNILVCNGFKPRSESVVGDIKNCFTKLIEISNTYDAYISVDLNGNVEIYIEYECGGEVAVYNTELNTDWDDEMEFFKELDDTVTYYLESWKY